jgi:site-specific DNA recombinase
MGNINAEFGSFLKRKEVEVKQNNDVWIYTRVSTKDQDANYSLINQREAAHAYSKQMGYTITHQAGGTYESASGDYTRREFSELIKKVNLSRKRPFAILVYTMSRFSRTGGGGIALAYELVDKMKVNLIEVSSGKGTVTEEGKLEIYAGLINAKRENLDRLKVTRPGMVKFAMEGNRFGAAPRGYDLHGPRTGREGRWCAKQKLVINEVGRKLQLAWKWKIDGEIDRIISEKLAALGVDMTVKQLNEMWNKPFYCGINVSKLCDNPVRGNWEPIVSQGDFLTLKRRREMARRLGKKQSKLPAHRPLQHFLRCSECNGLMTGYEVKDRKLHYYTCQECKGATMNAKTSYKRTGAHELFQDLLAQYELPRALTTPFKYQLKRTYEILNQESTDHIKMLRVQLDQETEKLKLLSTKFIYEGLDKSIYDEFKRNHEAKILEIQNNIDETQVQISNIDNYLSASADILTNLCKYWAFDDLKIKQKIQKLVFPNGLVLDAKKGQYLTSEINSVFQIKSDLIRVAEEKKMDISNNFIEMSTLRADEGTRTPTP